MILTNLLMHLAWCRWFYLWWRRETITAELTPFVTNPTRKQREEQCLWCWKEKHPHGVYPAHLTSSMCLGHKQQMKDRQTSSRIAARKVVAA